MKLEGKVAFRHSNIGLEPESESFVFIDDDRISDGYKLPSQKLKEYENEQGLDSLQYDMESVDCEKNEYEAKVKDLVEPVSHFNPREGEELPRNSVDVYMVKTVTECEPHPEVCYNESNYHVVKDICIDEGVLKKDNVVFVTPLDEKSHDFFPFESCETKEKQKDNTTINVLSLTPTEESDKVSANHNQHKDLMLTDVSGDVNKETPSLGGKVLLQDLLTEDSASSDDKGEQMEPEAMLSSPSLSVADGESKKDNKPQEPADCGKEECSQAGSCKCAEIHHTSRPIEWKSDDQSVTSLIRHSLGESSFSAVGPVSGRISYSGPVPYSGSISLRSDSSTTSTRSFAFPIIQSEWNSSPVRMAKADRGHHRKQRCCWTGGFLCCKF
ncbi:uncharacterized protein LOC114173892 isoform X1 [Vigna unguiculata]|uniref:uncharacterized protein LOC114173892 isoform X1 n=2 Tax=Vigna unguiculata TaxID=3917 RepID=UPI0010161BF7|nr:uncharacterized protein LOC114173892 isoform X1 [Vigna unguiculata]XP_027914356.1 uncharacterized protein LOC114173892 isoform X1 [Vigna unguiculata]XP_027914357.1 uncharacterized protein LOC114173892 isoform X1 [Vigna unguiculata]XP_027914358.1 uncharacterized protein LOC114173892 isoform X1 [Vigna unguiculata]XP_027914359.1 uncharacterized protein LOC114173892 isoform X1 [Vigna unguiculata]